MSQHEKIDYVEFPAKDLKATKAFFSALFGWVFTDYGDEYAAFTAAEAGLDGGFYKDDLISSAQNGGALLVFYSENLTHTQAKIESAGGSIIQPRFAFPGGWRFHFADPNGNEYAVWSEQG